MRTAFLILSKTEYFSEINKGTASKLYPYFFELRTAVACNNKKEISSSAAILF